MKGRPGGRIAGAAALAAACAVLWRLQYSTPWIVGYDGYYHIKVAALTRVHGLLTEFPWAAQSVWARHFADKELLYHLLLVPFTLGGDLIGGAKLSTLLLGVAVMGSFLAVARRNGLRPAWPWLLLLCAAGPDFLYRLTLPRPHLLSIVLALWFVDGLLGRRWRLLAVVAVLYPLSYTAFHLPLILASIVAVDELVSDGRTDWRVPALTLGGIVAGVLINPYFPDNLRIFLLQNVTVPRMALERSADLAMGSEFDALSTRQYVLDHLAFVVPLALAFWLALARPRPLGRPARRLLPLAAALVGLSLFSRRFVEYAAPVALLFCAGFYAPYLAAFAPRSWPRRRLVAALAIGVGAVAVAGFSFVRSYGTAHDWCADEQPLLRGAAEYLAANAGEDELVFTCDWDDAPELFFWDDRNRYPVFLDPTFMAADDPEAWREWTAAARGELLGRTWDTLARRYRYGVCTWDVDRLRWIVDHDPRLELVYDDGMSWVFRIDRDDPEIPMGDFLALGDPPWMAWPQ